MDKRNDRMEFMPPSVYQRGNFDLRVYIYSLYCGSVSRFQNQMSVYRSMKGLDVPFGTYQIACIYQITYQAVEQTIEQKEVKKPKKPKKSRKPVVSTDADLDKMSIEIKKAALIASLEAIKKVEEEETARELVKISKRQRRRSFRRKVSSIFAACIVICLVSGCLRVKMYLNDVAVVPSMVGMSIDDAKKMAAEQKLVPEITESYSSDVEKNTVMSQNIEQGNKVKQNTKINLVVSSGEEVIQLANYVGMNSKEANKTADDQKIRLTMKQIFSEKVATGQVIMQDHPAGTDITAGQEVCVTVSKGPQTVVIPDFTGKSKTEIKDFCNAAGLEAVIKWEKSDSVEDGYLLQQQIAPSQTVRKGANIEIILSCGSKMPSQMSES